MRRAAVGAFLMLGAALVFVLPAVARATPRMALTAAVPCSTCHVTPSGGGIRTQIGFLSMNDASLVGFDDVGLDVLQQDTNRFLWDRVWVGLDARLLLASLGRPTAGVSPDGQPITEVPPFRLVPMQLQPYIAVELFDGFTIDGSFDVGPNVYEGQPCSPVYAGQSCYTAAVQLDGGPSAPVVRAGMFQPGLGVRHDDHTVLTRANGSNPRRPFIPPNYAELGIELTWHPIPWLQVVAGVFDAGNLRVSLDRTGTPGTLPAAYLTKVSVAHTFSVGGEEASDAAVSAEDEEFFADEGAAPAPAAASSALHVFAGGSFYGERSFHVENLFAGLGTDFGLAFLGEVAHVMSFDTHHLNFMLMASYQPFTWLVFAARVERAAPVEPSSPEYVAQAVIGAEIFPIPFVELRPELRVVDTHQYVFIQPTLMIHLFY